MKNWKNNLKIVFIIRICYSLIFCASVITLFWKKYGLDLFDIFLLEAIFAISIVIFEIPTGYIADKLGRKLTLILSALICVAAWTFYSFSNTFWMFVFAEIVLGIGFSLLSGTDTALVYESLKSLGRDKEFTKIEGRHFSFNYIGEFISALSGGIIAYFLDIKYLLLLSGAAVLIAFIVSLFIKEPVRETYSHPKGTLYGFYKILRFIFLRSKVVKYVVFLLGFCSLATMMGVWFYQPLWQEKQIPVWLFGFLWACMSLPASLLSHFSHKIEKKLGKKTILWLMPLPAIIGYLLIAFLPSYLALLGIYLVPILRGMTNPVLAKYIHAETFSDKRATVMSVANWVFRISYFLLGPIAGWIGKNFGFFWGFIMCACVSLILPYAFIPILSNRVHLEFDNK